MPFNAVIPSTLLSVGSEAGICGDENAAVQAIRQGGVQRLYLSQSIVISSPAARRLRARTGQTAVDPTKPVARMLARFIEIDRTRSVIKDELSVIKGAVIVLHHAYE